MRNWMAALVVIGALATGSTALAAPEQEIQLGTEGNSSIASAIAFGPDGEIYLAGSYSGTYGSLTASDAADLFVQRIELDGTRSWEVSFDDGTEIFEDRRVRLWVDGAGNVWFSATEMLAVLDRDGSIIEPYGTPIGPISTSAGGIDANQAGPGVFRPVAAHTMALVQPDGSTDWTYDLEPSAPGMMSIPPTARATADGGAIVSVNSVTDTPNGTTSTIIHLDEDGAVVWRQDLVEKVVLFHRTPNSIQVVGSEVYVLAHVDLDPSFEGITFDDPEFFVYDLESGALIRRQLLDRSSYCSEDLLDDGFAAPADMPGICANDRAAARPFIAELAARISPDGTEAASYVGLLTPSFDEGIGRFDLTSDPAQKLLQMLPFGEGETFGDLAWDDNGDLWYVGGDGHAIARKNPWTHGFSDLTRPWQEEPVFWLERNGITTGVSPTEFAPDRNITRGELAALMYRANGDPDPGPGHGFLDVVRSWQQAPVSWLKSNAITTGVSATAFAPDRPVTRGEIAAFLWRMAGRPDVSTPHGFADVVAAWQQPAVRWLKSTGITAGVSPTEFAPDRPVTRAEVAAFLFRYNSTVGFPE